MHSNVKSVAVLAVLAFIVHASPASFAGGPPKMLSAMNPVGGLMGHVDDASGQVGTPENDVIDDEHMDGITAPFGEGDLLRRIPPAWQMCRHQLHRDNIDIRELSTNDALVNDMYPACKTLLAILTGEPAEEKPGLQRCRQPDPLTCPYHHPPSAD